MDFLSKQLQTNFMNHLFMIHTVPSRKRKHDYYQMFPMFYIIIDVLSKFKSNIKQVQSHISVLPVVIGLNSKKNRCIKNMNDI